MLRREHHQVVQLFICSASQFCGSSSLGGLRCSEPQIFMLCELFAREWFAKFIKSGAAMLRCGKLD